MAMNIEVSASVLSSIFFEHATSGSDLEGFLLGKISQKHTDTIDDAQINNVKEETTCYIYNFVLCREPCSWYSSIGGVDAQKMKTLLSEGKAKEVVGWYKFRRNTSLRTSLRERAIHHNLLDCFPGVLPKNFLFLLCAPQQSENRSTHTMDHVFQIYSDRRFQSLPVSVTNLGDSVSEYKTHSTTTVNCKTGQFSQIIKKHTKNFYSKQGQLQSVQSVHSMSSQLQKQLQDLSACVSSSEEELQHLRRDIRQLKSQLKPPAKHKTPAVKQDSNPFRGVDEDTSNTVPQLHTIAPTNPFYSALPGQKLPQVMANNTMNDDPPPAYSANDSQNSYPQSKNPFVTASTTLAPPEKDLISLRDSDDESLGAQRSRGARHRESDDDRPSTLMDMDMSQPLIHNVPTHATNIDWNNSNSNHADAFDFVSDIMKGKGGSMAMDKKEQAHASSRTTRSRTTTNTAKKPGKTMEAIEVSSDEDLTQDMDMTSDSPVY